MKWLARGLGVLAVLVLVALGVLAWALPRLAESEAARTRIQQVAQQVVGREVRYGELDFALFPPALEVAGPEVAGEPDGAPLARAERIALRVELWPLLRRELQVSSLRIDGLALHLVRTEEGLVLPRPEPRAGGGDGSGRREPGAPGSETAPDEPADPSDDGLAYGIRRVALRDASVAIEDRSQRPPALWRFEGIDADVRGGSEGEPVAIEGSLEAATGPALDAQGAVRLESELSELSGAATGPFRIDASDARLAWGAELRKPAGTRAIVRGELVRDPSGALGADGLEIELRDLVARGALRTAPRTVLSLRAEPVALAGWAELVPSLGVVPLEGRLAVPELSVSTGPLEARGRIGLVDVVASPPGRPPLAIEGDLELLGTSLRTRDLVVRAAGQPITVSASVSQLFDGPRYEVAFETIGADADALLGAFAGQSGRLQGPLDAKGTFRGTLGGDTSFTDALSGNFAFDIERGQIVGTPLIERVLGPLGAQLAEVGRGRGVDLERFYGETFEILEGDLRVEGGQVFTRPVLLRYRDWTATLEGPITLADLSLDMRGSLTIFEAVDAALARAFGARDDYVPRRRTIELAAVRGRLGDPKVQLAGNSLTAIASAYAQAVGRDELRRQVEKQLGEGSGEIVDQGVKVLEGLFGRGRGSGAGSSPEAGSPEGAGDPADAGNPEGAESPPATQNPE